MPDFFSKRDRNSTSEAETRRQQEAFRSYLDAFKIEVLRLIRARPIAKWADEPLAPWVCHHYPLEFDPQQMASRGIDPRVYCEKASFYWFTLDAAHCTQSFLEHFSSLELQDKVDYFQRYDLGPTWPDREHWFHVAFGEDASVSDGDYEFAHAQVFSTRRLDR